MDESTKCEATPPLTYVCGQEGKNSGSGPEILDHGYSSADRTEVLQRLSGAESSGAQLYVSLVQRSLAKNQNTAAGMNMDKHE
jgi:hypothetical protein